MKGRRGNTVQSKLPFSVLRNTQTAASKSPNIHDTEIFAYPRVFGITSMNETYAVFSFYFSETNSVPLRGFQYSRVAQYPSE